MDAPPNTRRTWIVDSVLIFVVMAALLGPLFRIKYLHNWASIESIFIADARALRDSGFSMRWQPDWYTGTRYDYIYPPALRYGTALIATYPGMTTGRAYHIYTAFFYCLGIVGVYWLARTGTGSRWWGLAAAAAAALVSPAYLFIRDVARDARIAGLPPQRLNSLVRYGEGPHITAFGWLGIALACAWRGLRPGRDGWLALSVLGIVMVVSNNFYGATALVLLYPALVWALWVTHAEKAIWGRAFLAAALSCGLTAFWLVPSYIRLTLSNLKHVSQPGTNWSRGLMLGVVVVLAAATWRWARRRPQRAWPVFVLISTVLLCLNVLGNYYFNFRVLGEPQRLIPEMDLAVILALLAVLQWLWTKPRVPRWVFVLPVLLVLGVSRHYWRAPYGMYVRSEHTERIEYQLTRWIHENLPGQRVFATGSLRFWYNAWFDGPMVGGGSEQGLLNQYTVPVMWAVCLDPNPAIGTWWLQALGADAIAVHDKTSMEIYKDIPEAGKFKGYLPPLFDNGRGDVIYRIPRRFPGLARVVDTRRLDELKPMPEPGDNALIQSYAELLEKGPDVRPDYRWETKERMRIKVRLEPGQSLMVLETFDPNWRARAGGRELPVRQAMMQFMRIDAPPGEHEIILQFDLPLENKAGRVLTVFSAVGLGVLAWRSRRRHAVA